ncbi:PAS domain-containing protein, partial [Mesonia mobilis]
MHHHKDYKSLLEKTATYAKMGSWEVDLREQKVYWSKVTKFIHEVEEDYNCTLEQALSFYKDPKSLELITKSIEEAISKNKEYDVKIKITTGKGREIWVRAIGIPVFEDNECTSVYGLFQDIDREERKQERLHKQVQFINHVLKNTSVGIVLSDEHCMIKDINHGFTQLVGYDLKEA